ncbi:MAG: hypothetical protein GKR90_01275 [Pseudomonadales bacterium]|nr:hypothetical protein [Pseudomonadales bacterium]
MMKSISLSLTLLLTVSTAFADIPRTPNGKPNLQGTWANNAATPLERPEQLADRSELTAEEVARFKEKHDQIFDGEGEAAFGDSVFQSVLANDQEHESYDPETGNYNHFWVVEREFENRTSLITDPPTGRLPTLVPAAVKALEERIAYAEAHPADSYTDRINSDRCITFGVPFIGAGYNGYFEITQSNSHVAIMQEMSHETRVIPVDNRPHIPGNIDQWIGDAKGRWEGDAFVVETKNFAPGSSFMQHPSENLHLIERYELIDADTLAWVLTVQDETIWSSPWTLQINLKRSAEPIFEYACHEGNLSMEGILAGHRAKEAEAAALQGSGGQE